MKALAGAVLVLCGIPAATATAAAPVKVEDMHRLARVAGARLSPDGKWVAFGVTRSDVAKNRSATNLWLVSTAPGSAPQPLTFGEKGANADPRFSPDSRFLYFVS